MGGSGDRPPNPQHHSPRKADSPFEAGSCRCVYVTAVPDSYADRRGIARNSALGTVRYAIDGRLCSLRAQETQLHVECHSTTAWTPTIDGQPALDTLRQVVVRTRALR